MERLVYWHLLETSLKENPLSERQHAFRTGYSTDTALSMTVGKIERGMLRKRGLSLALFLDIAGAFDNLSTSYASKSMLNRGFDPKMVNWYTYYLNNRSCSVTIKGVTRRRSLRRGVPQGGILSPLCWNIAVDELLKLFDELTDDELVLVNAYADDLVLIINGTDSVAMFIKLQQALHKVQGWAAEAGLRVSAAKSQAVLFTRMRKFFMPPNIVLDGVDLLYQEEVKYLGLWLDRGLTWSLHMEKKFASCRRLLMQLKGSIGKLWGPTPYLIRWSYLCVVRPSLLYGHFIWGHACYGHYRSKFASLQRTALSLSGHFRKATPGEGLNLIMHVPPLDIHLRGEIVRSHFRLTGKLVGPFYKRVRGGHLLAAERLFAAAGVPVVDMDPCVPVNNEDRRYKVMLASFKSGKQVNSDKLAVFTDGSKNADSHTGLGVTISLNAEASLDYSAYLGTHTSVFQSETLAITRACSELTDLWLGRAAEDRRVIIYTDNQAVLQALN
jgi:hypothetical protein